MKAGLKVNLKESFPACTEIDYPGNVITREGTKPHPKKIQAILALKPPRTTKELKSLLGMVQYYRDMWPRRSHILAPLTDASSSKKKKLDWTKEMDKAFIQMKQIIAQETILALPDYDKPFQIYTDASDYQLGRGHPTRRKTPGFLQQEAQ